MTLHHLPFVVTLRGTRKSLVENPVSLGEVILVKRIHDADVFRTLISPSASCCREYSFNAEL